jgi:hypothetical protein
LCEQVEAERCSKLLGSTNDDSKLFRMVWKISFRFLHFLLPLSLSLPFFWGFQPVWDLLVFSSSYKCFK